MSLVHKYLRLNPSLVIAPLHGDVLCTFTHLDWICLPVRLKAWSQICSCDAWAQICLQYSCHSCAQCVRWHLCSCTAAGKDNSLVFSHRQTVAPEFIFWFLYSSVTFSLQALSGIESAWKVLHYSCLSKKTLPPVFCVCFINKQIEASLKREVTLM